MPDEGTTAWDDAVAGRIEFPNEKLEDVVLVRSDGRPTYNFASPVEDWLDGITHVIRGEDHVSNTPKQIRILEALGADAARLRARPERPRAGRQEALQAPRRRLGRGVPRARATSRRRSSTTSPCSAGATTTGRRSCQPRRARRAIHARARRLEPGHVRLPKLEWMNGVYLRAMPPDEYADALVAYLREQGYRRGTRSSSAAPRRSCRRRSRRSASSRRSPASSSGGSSPTRSCSTARAPSSRRRATRWPTLEPFDGGADRGGAPRARRAARPEAAPGVPADPHRGHRVEGLAGALRDRSSCSAATRRSRRLDAAPQCRRTHGGGGRGRPGTPATRADETRP